jgi:hypothetical protein
MNTVPDQDKPLDLRTVEGAKLLMRDIARLATGNFNRDGFLTQVAFVVMTRNPKNGEPIDPTPAIIPMPPITPEVPDQMVHALKDQFEAIITQVLDQGNGIAVLIVSECWKAPPEKAQEAIEWLKAGKTLAHFPGRLEQAFVTLCHKELKNESVAMWAEIVREDGIPPRLGNWHEEPPGPAEGRFAEFFG